MKHENGYETRIVSIVSTNDIEIGMDVDDNLKSFLNSLNSPHERVLGIEQPIGISYYDEVIEYLKPKIRENMYFIEIIATLEKHETLWSMWVYTDMKNVEKDRLRVARFWDEQEK